MRLVDAPTQVFGGSSCDVSNCYDVSFGKMTDTFFGNDWETLELFYCWKPGRSCEAVTFFQYSL